MDQQGPHSQGQPPVMGVVGGSGALPYGTPPPFPSPQMVASGSPVGGVQPMGQPVPFTNNPAQLAIQQQMAYQQMHQQQQAQQNHQLEIFWANQLQEIEQTSDFKNHSLPLARIKKIMKADEDVRMIAAEAPVIFAKACEMFILELTLRSWIHTEENKRRTLQKNDIAAAITRTDIFDFLVDIVPRDEMKDEVMAGMVRPPTGAVAAPPPEAAVPYFYMAPPAAAAGVPPGMMIGRPAMDPTMYMQHPHPYLPPQMWQQQPLPQQPPPPQGGHDEGDEM